MTSPSPRAGRPPGPSGPPGSTAAAAPSLGPWRFVVWFGVVALLGDILYEGARSVTGPLLAGLGASALVVGVVTGVGETAALLLRLVSGPAADRSGRFWSWTIAGYVLTVLSVPFLGLVPALWMACALVVLERVGKAVRAPAKDTLLSHATSATGRGKGFAVHEAIDQVGALLGPLLVAAVLAGTDDDYGPAMLLLAVPGVALLVLVVALARRVPDPRAYEEEPVPDKVHASAGDLVRDAAREPLPRRFWGYAAFTGLTMAGFATFGVIGFHLVESGLLAAAAVPLVYAATQLVDAGAALLTGWGYDRFGGGVLVSLPVVAAVVPGLAFSDVAWVAVAGAMAWGVALGIQESTLRATVADLVPSGRRATAYGVLGAVVGSGAFLGGTLAGALYEVSVPVLVVVTAALQAAALVVLIATLRPPRRPARAAGPRPR